MTTRLNILLINPPCGPRTIGLRNIARIEPLGLEMIGAGVSADHEVRLVDMEVRPADLAEMLQDFRPDVVGITSEIVHVETALAALREVRRTARGASRWWVGTTPRSVRRTSTTRPWT